MWQIVRRPGFNWVAEQTWCSTIKVKRSTTRKQVRRRFAGQGPRDPEWLLHNYPGRFVVSHGRTVVWRSSFPRGKYLEACSWPSDDDGASHADMGMWNITLR